MKFKFVAGVMLFCGISASAGAQGVPVFGALAAPGFNLINLGQAMLSPLLAPVLNITGPAAGQFVAFASPAFFFPVLGTFAPLLPLSVLPGLPPMTN